MGVTITKNAGKLILEDIGRQWSFATSLALNRTAFDMRDALRVAAAEQLDDPIEFTLRGFLVKTSTKASPTAIVFIEEKRDDYMRYLVTGGIRMPKTKRALVVPTVNIRLNRFGNIPGRSRGAIAKLLANKKLYFSGKPKGLQLRKPSQTAAGVWKRNTPKAKRPRGRPRKGEVVSKSKVVGTIKRVVAYTEHNKYEPKKFDFHGIAERTYIKRWPINLKHALERVAADAVRRLANKK